jgi:hypothetical protein
MAIPVPAPNLPLTGKGANIGKTAKNQNFERN